MEKRVKEILAVVFNLETPEGIRDTDSIIGDLGADSLDFVEILHLVERTFGVVLKTDEIMLGTGGLKANDLFVEGRLTGEGAEILRANLGARGRSIEAGMGKVALFSMLTVGDLTEIIRRKMETGGENV